MHRRLLQPDAPGGGGGGSGRWADQLPPEGLGGVDDRQRKIRNGTKHSGSSRSCVKAPGPRARPVPRRCSRRPQIHKVPVRKHRSTWARPSRARRSRSAPPPDGLQGFRVRGGLHGQRHHLLGSADFNRFARASSPSVTRVTPSSLREAPPARKTMRRSSQSTSARLLAGSCAGPATRGRQTRHRGTVILMEQNRQRSSASGSGEPFDQCIIERRRRDGRRVGCATSCSGRRAARVVEHGPRTARSQSSAEPSSVSSATNDRRQGHMEQPGPTAPAAGDALHRGPPRQSQGRDLDDEFCVHG